MAYPHLIHGIWSPQFFTGTRIRIKNGGDPYKSPTRKRIHGKIDDLSNVDFISSNVNSSRQEALLYIFEDNEAVIKMIIKGRSTCNEPCFQNPQSCSWLVVWQNQCGPQDLNQIHWHQEPTRRHIDKGKFHTWWMETIFCVCFNISHFSYINSLEAMSKRTQEDAGEERVTAKSKPMMNLVSRQRVRDPNVLASTVWESPVKTKSESQNVSLSSWNEHSNQERWDLWWALAPSDDSQHGTLTTSGLLKCGKKCRTQVQGDPYMTSLPSMMIWRHRHIKPFSEITIILEQSKWSIAKDVGPFSRRCNARYRQTFYDLVNVCVFDIGSHCIHGKELLKQFAFHQKIQGNISLWNK